MPATGSHPEDIWAEFAPLWEHLDERTQRLVAAARARVLGEGGIEAVHVATGMAVSTIRRGVVELEGAIPPAAPGRVRRDGGGRTAADVAQPGLLEALDQLVHPYTRGDPESPLRWTTKSTAKLSRELAERGFRASPRTVAKCLRKLGYSLQAPSKRLEGASHPDRDEQFAHIAAQAQLFEKAGQPVISVDTKKRELIGNFDRGGSEWQPTGEPELVQSDTFPDPSLGKILPYGVYDVANNRGWVNVGIDHDTAAFAVEGVRRWWNADGVSAFPGAGSLLITADGGGSNASRSRLWKVELQRLANETGLMVTVCHFPPGTSKWNKVEHRLFSQITLNMRGRALTTREVALDVIGATTTKSGLKVTAKLDDRRYPTGIRVGDEELRAVALQRNPFHGEWNYTIHPVPGARNGVTP